MTKRGFTLVELLVTLVIASLVVAGIFQMFTSSSEGFRVQGQASRTQDELRTGLRHIKTDLKKAGFLATPNSAADPIACLTPAPLRALSLELSEPDSLDSPSVANPDMNRNIQPVMITLLGPYVTGRAFRTASVSGNQVTLLTADTLDLVANYPTTQALFDSFFVPGRIIRLVNPDQMALFATIQAADFGTGTLTVDPPLPRATADLSCGYAADGGRMEVSLLSFVRYRVALDTSPRATPAKTDLIREEMRLTGGALTAVAGSQLRVAEYVVDLLLYDMLFDNGTSGAPALTLVPTIAEGGVLNGDGTGLLERGAGAQPEKLRSVTVKLSARTADEDLGVPLRTRATPFAPLINYEVLPAFVGAATVDTLATRVELTTFRQRAL